MAECLTPDLLSVLIVVATQARGISALPSKRCLRVVCFSLISLLTWEAQIILCDPHRAVVVGHDRKITLRGGRMSSPDIRAGIALLIAAMSAKGTSRIDNIEQIDRGYEHIEDRLNALGAIIKRGMIRREDVYKIGKLGKTHGVRGEISFLFDDDVFDRTDADYLVFDIDGILVPFFLEEYRFKNDSNALLKLDGIDTQEQAQELTGCDVYFPRKLADSDSDNISWAEIIGYSVIDAKSKQDIGKIASVDDNTINILFELEDGKLIPASEELIKNIDTKRHQIEINLPEGILDL